MTISMNIERMEYYAKEFEKRIEPLQEAVNSMTTVCAEMEGEWQGGAATAFLARYEEIRPSFERAPEVVREISAALTNAATQTESLDRDLAQGLGG